MAFHKVKNFDDILFNIISLHEGFKDYVHDDGRGIPTIGAGFALLQHGNGSYELDTSKLDKYNIFISDEDIKKLEQMKDLIDAGKVAEARKLLKNKNHFKLRLTKEQGKKIYDDFKKEKMAMIKRMLGKDLFSQLEETQELIAFTDLAYNGAFTSELANALKEGKSRQYIYAYISNILVNDKAKVLNHFERWYEDANVYGAFEGDKPTNEELNKLEEINKESKNIQDAAKKKWDAYLATRKKDRKSHENKWHTISDFISATKSGRFVAWRPPNPIKSGTKKPGISPEQLSIMREYLLPQSMPQSTGLSSYEQIMRRYTGAGSDAPMKNINDPYQDIRDRYGDN